MKTDDTAARDLTRFLMHERPGRKRVVAAGRVVLGPLQVAVLKAVSPVETAEDRREREGRTGPGATNA